MTEQGQRFARRSLAYERNEVLQVILKLADEANVASVAGAAMTANVGRIGFDAAPGERVRQGVHRDARSRRAMDENGDPAA